MLTQLWTPELLGAGQLLLKIERYLWSLVVARATQGIRPRGMLCGSLLTRVEGRVLTGPKQCRVTFPTFLQVVSELCRTLLYTRPAPLQGEAVGPWGARLAMGSPLVLLQIAYDDEKMTPRCLNLCTRLTMPTNDARPPWQHLSGPLIDLFMVPDVVKRTIELKLHPLNIP